MALPLSGHMGDPAAKVKGIPMDGVISAPEG
jgi:hypothetical protein